MMRVAAIQCSSVPSVEESLAGLLPLVDEALDQQAELLLLPENFAFLGESAAIREAGPRIAEQGLEFLARTAAERACWIVGGGLTVPADGQLFYNRSVVASPHGLVAHYDKIHLFDTDLPDRAYRESDVIRSGDRLVTVPVHNDFVLGLSICYDLRFPELYRKLVDEGANVLTVPAAFTRPTGQDHWESLLRARAIENTCYVVAAAQCGTHYDGRSTYGHSMIIDPWGQVVGQLGEEPGVLIHDLDLQCIHDVRKRIPCLDHRQL